MGINQVVRGRDLLGSCARQIYLHELLGFVPPAFAHVPLLTSRDGRRLSTRDKDLDLGAIREQDKGPEKLIGWLGSYVGLCEPEDEVAAADLIERFSWEKIRHAAGAGDISAYTYS
jgi:glutamyl-tRNA synthetase